MLKKKEYKVARTEEAASELEQRDRAMDFESRPVNFGEEEKKTEG